MLCSAVIHLPYKPHKSYSRLVNKCVHTSVWRAETGTKEGLSSGKKTSQPEEHQHENNFLGSGSSSRDRRKYLCRRGTKILKRKKASQQGENGTIEAGLNN